MDKPLVAVVGRPNVGKSTLFNAIINKRISIVEDVPGVTRDRIYYDAEWLGNEFTLIDTGGIEFLVPEADRIAVGTRAQAQLAILEADVILLVCDGRTGITADDEQVANLLRSAGKPVLPVVNKIDSPAQEMNTYEFYNLGLGDPWPVSAANRLGLGDLLDEVVRLFPTHTLDPAEDALVHIALVGRPNVGKSSLTNALLGEERVLVTDVPGTTRDSIDTHWKFNGEEFVLIDTAGMRRKAKVDLPVEHYSVLRSLRAINRSDIVVLVLDAMTGVTEQDTKIAGYAHEAGKGLIILVNKWDLPTKDNHTMAAYTEEIRNKLAFAQYAPILYVSAKTGQRLHRLGETVQAVAEQQSLRVSTGVLNELLADMKLVNPPPMKYGQAVRLYYMTQVGVKPPTFVVFANHAEYVHFSYVRFIENRLRESFGFEGTPIRLVLRGKKDGDDE
ncbi:MAG: ribosome biogenesis GTPase Der [Veillonellaceae bacterium]|nr:ribosome biogenesis GTPase Der [Veillonellaceae bacterium]